MASAKLKVTGMTCGHCQKTVEQALKGVTGVYSAVVDLQDGEAEIDFDDDAVTTGTLVAAVEKAGYRARLAG
ncbi:MAG TPA: cation transporter [Gemmatimonadales bacterium]|nr:cation transporter [Gemmatimonadales bacterium]